MRGRWAAGIVPRNFSWIIKDRLAVSERPGGYARNHRKVRRQEELLWLKAQHFDRVVSLLGSNHNLHAYDEQGLTWSHVAMSPGGDTARALAVLYPWLYRWLRQGERLLIHQDELGDSLMGVIAGYLLWSGLIPDGPRAITAAEQLLKRQMGAVGRQMVAVAGELEPPGRLAAAPMVGSDTPRPQSVAESGPKDGEEGPPSELAPGLAPPSAEDEPAPTSPPGSEQGSQ